MNPRDPLAAVEAPVRPQSINIQFTSETVPMPKPVQPSKKALHVGVVQEGRFIEDRWFLDQHPITVGTAAKNTFAMPLSALGISQPLFTHNKQGQLLLHFNENARGRITINNRDYALEDARREGLAIANAGHFEIPFTESMRGRITLGEASFVFNFSSAPPKPSTPKLPREIRGTIWNITDHTFMSVLSVSMVIHTFLVGTISRRDLPPETPLFDQTDDSPWQKFIFPDKPPPEKEEPKVEQLKDTPVAKSLKMDTKTEPAMDSVEHKRDVQRKVAQTGLIHLIGAVSGSGGALGNVFASTDSFTNDISAALKEAGNNLAIASTGAAPTRRGEDSGSVAQIGSVIGTRGAGPLKVHEKQDVAVTAGVLVDDAEIDSSTVDKDALFRVIRQHLPSVKGCYEAQLKRSPMLRGKLVMHFTIAASGHVTDVGADSNSMGSDEVEACIIRLIKSWVFPFKPESDTTVSFPFLFTPAN